VSRGGGGGTGGEKCQHRRAWFVRKTDQRRATQKKKKGAEPTGLKRGKVGGPPPTSSKTGIHPVRCPGGERGFCGTKKPRRETHKKGAERGKRGDLVVPGGRGGERWGGRDGGTGQGCVKKPCPKCKAGAGRKGPGKPFASGGETGGKGGDRTSRRGEEKLRPRKKNGPVGVFKGNPGFFGRKKKRKN